MYFLTGKLNYNGQTSSLELCENIFDKLQILPRSTLIPYSTFSISFDLPDLKYNVGRYRVLVSVVECGDVSKVCVCVYVCVCFRSTPSCLSKCLISCETAIHAHRNIAEYVNIYSHHNLTVVIKV